MKTATCHTDKKHYAKGFCRSCHKKDWYRRNPGAIVRHHRETYLRRRALGKVQAYEYRKMYGITVEQHERLIKEQLGRCAICKVAFSETKKGACVDHNHSTGKVRGLLCMQCNFGLGHFRDSKELLQAAVNYL